MADSFQNLAYYVMLTDPVLVSSLQGPSGGAAASAPIFAPDAAAVSYSAPILAEGAPFVAPCIKSPWFDKGFPTNVATFERHTGGLWGLPSFLPGAGGDTITYVWRAHFVYVPPPEPAGQPTPPYITQLRWADGFELPDLGEGGTGALTGSFASVVSSRRPQGMGLSLRSSASLLRTHNCTENGGSAPQDSWERFYVRLQGAPAAQTVFWQANSSVGSAGVALAVLPSGQVAAYYQDDVGALTLIATIGTLTLNRWYKIDVLVFFGNNGMGPPVTPNLQIWLSGESVLSATDVTKTMATAGRKHGTSTMGVNGANTLALDVDDWTAGPHPPAVGAGADFQFGTAIVPLRVKSFASAVGWTGDFRNLLQNPINGSTAHVDNAGAGAVLTVNLDADVSADAIDASFGVVAVIGAMAGAHITASSTLQLAALGYTPAPKTISANGLSTPAWRYQFVPIAAAQLNGTRPIAPMTLTYTKNGAGAEEVWAMAGLAVLNGVFGPEDVFDPIVDIPTVPEHLGAHNAPYPRTPWALLTEPPIKPVFLVSGTYVGNGTGQDLSFQYPIHFLRIRPLTGDTGGVWWWSSLDGAHQSLNEFPKANLMVQALQDPTYVPGAGYGPDQNDEPPHPATVLEAIALANTLAYGWDKHVNDGFWDALYLADPGYAWSRMLGSGAGGADVAIFGKYAVPPSPWNQPEFRFLIRLAGSDTQNNANAVTYCYTAISDPGARFMLNAGLANGAGSADHDTPLINPEFTPLGLFLLQEILSTSATFRTYYKGPGHATASISPLDVAEIAAALQFAKGRITSKSAIHLSSPAQIPFSAWRVDDGTGHAGRVVQMVSYVGDGTASRTIALTPVTGNRPIFALVVPHNAAAVTRDTSHTGTTSTVLPATANASTGITGGGVDSISVGSVLNANGITYDVFVIPGSPVACNGGFGCPGPYVPVPPESLSINPDHGSTAGGTDVQITGGVFVPGTTVSIGGVDAPVSSITSAAINAVTGPHAEGTVDVVITPPVGVTGQIPLGYTYVDQVDPSDLTITPDHGSTDGGTRVTIGGGGFIPTSTVTIGGVALTDLAITADTILGTTGTHAAGLVDVVVLNGTDPRGTITNGYTYVVGPDVVNPDPPTGPMPDLDDDLDPACKPDTTRIVNVALSRLGVSQQITDLATEVTSEAVQVRLVYVDAIQATLRDFPWPFATRFVQLDLVAANPNSDWLYSYRQPNDCIFERRLVVVRSGAVDPTPPPFQLSSDDTGGLLFTNQANAVLEYTARPKCPHTRSEPLFRDAVSWKLAEALAPALTRMESKVVDCQKMYWATLEQARLVLRPGTPGEVAAATTVDTSAAAKAANVAVVNRALVRIGARTIRNLTTDQSREAQAARLIFEDELRSVLRDFAWPFATLYLSPAFVGGTATSPVNGDWTYSYRLTSAVLYARRLVTSTKRAYDPNPAQFRLGQDATGPLLFTNEATPITLEFTTRPEAAVQIADPLFRDAFAWRLAASLAPSLAQVVPEAPEQIGRGPDDPAAPKERQTSLAQLRARATAYAWQMYERTIAKAQVAAANEGQPDPAPVDADWIRGR